MAPPTGPVSYRSHDDDNARWLDFEHRPGDIVISTRSKCGTTWMQMICALLVFQTPKLPAPLGELSPWLDWLVIPWDEMDARLRTQDHRRFIKTHTPLDGLPLRDDVTYIVVGRHPLDVAVSLYHHGDNLDRARISELTGNPDPLATHPPRPPLHQWVVDWFEWECTPQEMLDSLPGLLWHVGDAWDRARSEPNIVLVHYDDLLEDLEGEMRRLAAQLGIAVDESVWPSLVEAATFEQMGARAEELAPDPVGVLKDRRSFFRRGSSGEGRALLTPQELDRYEARAATLASADFLRWLHR